MEVIYCEMFEESGEDPCDVTGKRYGHALVSPTSEDGSITGIELDRQDFGVFYAVEASLMWI